MLGNLIGFCCLQIFFSKSTQRNYFSVKQSGPRPVAGLTLPFAIVAICYKKGRVATDLFHWQKVHFRQIISPFSPIMVQNLLTGDLCKHVYPAVWDFQYWPDWVTR